MKQMQFSDFELDLDLFTLRRKGQLVSIGQRPLDLLICLIKNRDRVVSSEFLRREVWNSTALSPAAIPTCIRELRKILGDDAATPAFIESKRGRGYRFMASADYTPATQHSRSKSPSALSFVGREPEIGILRTALRTTVTEARSQLVLIQGEAGMGKTRLVSEFLGAVPESIYRNVIRSKKIQSTLPFSLWTQLIRNILSEQLGKENELLANARILAMHFPGIQNETSIGPEKGSPLDRFSILTQWARTIRSIGPSKPLILAFEDIQWADFDSIVLLAWLAEELSCNPCMLVATHRPLAFENATAQGINEVQAVPHCIPIDLSPLAESDISLLLDPYQSDRQALSQNVHSRTSGNAFYVGHEIHRIYGNSVHDADHGDADSLPSRNREIVSRQLSDLPAETREALAFASIAGKTFSIPVIASALKMLPTELLAALEPARRTWLVREDGGTFAFRHAVLCEALYNTIGSSRRREFHLRIAEGMIQSGRTTAEAAAISDHLMNAAPLSEPTKLRHFSVVAARQASAAYDFSTATVYFQRALDTLDSDADYCIDSHCRILIDLAAAQHAVGNRHLSRSLILKAAELARSADTPDLVVECALGLAPDYLSIEVGTYDLTQIRLIEEALVATPVDRTSIRARLLARYSQAMLWSGNPAKCTNLAIDALRLARESKDPDALIAALSARAETLHGPHRTTDRIEILSELQVTINSRGSVAEKLLHHTRMITALLEHGDIAQLDAENRTCLELAEKTGLPHFMWYPESTQSMRDLMSGQVRIRSRLSERFEEVQRLTGDANAAQGYAAQEIFRQIEMDRSKDVLPFVQDFASKQGLVHSWSAAVAWLQWDACQIPEARDSLNRFDSEKIAQLLNEPGGGIGIASLAEVAAHVGEAGQRQRLYDVLRAFPERCAIAGYGVLYFGSFARYAGLLAESLGHPADAHSSFLFAIDCEAKRNAATWQGYAEIDFARFLFDSSAEESVVLSALLAAERTLKRAHSPRLARRHRATACHVRGLRTP